MKIIKLLILLLFFIPNLYAQSEVNYSDIQKEWKLYQEKSGVMIYYKSTIRDDYKNGIHQELILFKMVNATNINLEVTWKNELWYNDECWNCDKDDKEHLKQIYLNAGDSEEGDVDRIDKLCIFSKDLDFDSVKLTKFKFINLGVNPTRLR